MPSVMVNVKAGPKCPDVCVPAAMVQPSKWSAQRASPLAAADADGDALGEGALVVVGAADLVGGAVAATLAAPSGDVPGATPAAQPPKTSAVTASLPRTAIGCREDLCRPPACCARLVGRARRDQRPDRPLWIGCKSVIPMSSRPPRRYTHRSTNRTVTTGRPTPWITPSNSSSSRSATSTGRRPSTSTRWASTSTSIPASRWARTSASSR